MKYLQQFGAWAKPLLHPAKALGIMALGLVLLTVLEIYSAWYAFASAPAKDLWQTPWGEYPRAALLHSSLSIVCGLMAFIGMAVAGGLKDDERKRISGRAWAARAVAICLLGVPGGPIANLGGAFALDRQQKQWDSYVASPAYTSDKADLASGIIDPMERELVKDRVTPPSTGKTGVMDWLTAVLLHCLVMWSASAFRLAPPITAEERLAMAEAERLAREEAKRRERNKRRREARKAKVKASDPGVIRPMFGQKRG